MEIYFQETGQNKINEKKEMYLILDFFLMPANLNTQFIDRIVQLHKWNSTFKI